MAKTNEDESRVYRGIRWERTGHHYKACAILLGKHYKTGEILRHRHVLFQRTVKSSVTFERVLHRWGRRMVDKAIANKVVAVDGAPWEIHLIKNEAAHAAAVAGFKSGVL